MGNSYWMKDQQGNFSDNQNDTFDEKKRYIGLRLQQGVPLLDRDWNELEDIRRYEEQMLRKHYIGNGTPDDGFRISACNPPANDFKIGIGRCLVDGFEVVNEPPESKQYINYTDQKLEALTPPTDEDREDTVYLDVWIEEVRSQGKDDPLNNPQDLNEETTVRHRLLWRVRVDVGSKEEYLRKIDTNAAVREDKYKFEKWGQYPVIGSFPDAYCPLSNDPNKFVKLVIDSDDKYTLKTGEKLDLGQGYALEAKQVDVDGKKVWLEFSKDGQYIDDQIVSTDSGDSTWTCKVDDVQGEDDVPVLKVHVNQVFQGAVDSIAQIDGLWLIDYKKAFKRELYHHYYDIARINRKKGVNEILDADITDLRDINGKEALSTTEKKFNDIINSILKGNLPSISETKLLTTSDNLLYTILKSRNGDIWLFWDTDEGQVTNFWCKVCKGGNWGPDTKLTTDALQKVYVNHFEDHSGNVWLLWFDESNNFWCKNCTKGNSGSITQLTTGDTPDKTILTKQFFEDHNGDLLFFWYSTTEDGVTNFWCKRYKNGYWEDEEWIATVNLRSPAFLDIIEDHDSIWFFWRTEEYTETEKIWCKRYKDGRWEKDSKLVTDRLGYDRLFKDHNDNILLFGSFEHREKIFGSLRCIDGDNWGELKRFPGMENESNIYRGLFEDLNGNVWLFWSNDDEIFCSRYYEENDEWEIQTRLTSNFSHVKYLDLFEDHHSNIWLFWKAGESGDNDNIWCKRIYCKNDKVELGNDEKLTTSSLSKKYLNLFEDHDGNILLFWYTERETGIIDFWCNRMHWTKDSYDWGPETKLAAGTRPQKEFKEYLLEDLNGITWFLFCTPEYNNIWCKRYIDGDWMTETRLTSGTTKKEYISSVADNDGNISLLWIDTENSLQVSNLMYKKFYTSI